MPETRRFAGYHSLMQHRVRDILLVASPYDSFILEEDGQLSERIFSQYLELNLSASPRFTTVPTGRQAHAELAARPHDLVITTPHCADLPAAELARGIRAAHPDLPVVMLAYDRLTAQTYAALGPGSGFEEVFLWTGDPRLLLVIVKSVEDRLNVDHDTREGQVRVILVVEDSPTFYSAYLPIIYTELLLQTKSVMSDTLNEADRMYRMRARPKILMARTSEGGERLIEAHRDHLQGVVIDMRFPRGGKLDPHAGRAMIEKLQRELPDVPILLQSAEPEHLQVARALGVAFADKNSPDLLAELRKFMFDHLGFGPFVFRLPDGTEVSRAAEIQGLVQALATIPGESLAYHLEHLHLSNWLMTRCEFDLATVVRPLRPGDYRDIEEARRHLLEILSHFLERRQRGLVTFYVRGADPLQRDFSRIGKGSLGGKARGIAFCCAQLARDEIHEKHPGVRIFVPRTKVICTEVFDRFVERDELRWRAIAARSDEDLARLFLDQPLEEDLLADLEAILREVRYPLAVRSSGLFEDSEFEPLAGLYKTIIVPNCAASEQVRLEQLARAIRLVYASTFFRGPRSYMEAGSRRLEEEKMAVVIQRLVGSRHGNRFYPDFSGVAQSHNFYPVGYLAPEEGIATVALGLGQTVVEGGKAWSFCPRHPAVALQNASTDDILRNSQREFFALDLSAPEMPIEWDADSVSVQSYDLATAEQDGTLLAVGATYSPDDDRVYDTIYRSGVRLVNFAGVLEHGRFPLAEILIDLLELGQRGLGVAAELEFAVSLAGKTERPELALLQLRPLVAQPLSDDVDAFRARPHETTVLSAPALGSGVIGGIRDVVYVHPERFRPDATRHIAAEIERINARLVAQRRPYLLIGPGRWGTADRWLGIPVTWPMVCGARVIVELAFPGFRVDQSQGTHFFHTITSLRIGYFTIDLTRGDVFLDLDLLESLPVKSEGAGARHVELPGPLEVRIDARNGMGVAVLGSEHAMTSPVYDTSPLRRDL